MSKYPQVSIIIPFYNCAYVHHAIESALGQSYPNIQIIVVNDGSSKNSHLIQPYLNQILYIEKSNGGTGSALNTGIQAATGDYFSWLSSDDIYDRDKVKKQLAYMQEHNALVSYTSYYHIDANNNQISGAAGIGCVNKLQFYKTMQRGCIINGCTVMLHMDVFKSVGLFNETYKYTQDYDLWMRVLQQYEFYYLDEPIVLYRVHEAMGTKNHEPLIIKEIHNIQQAYRRTLDELIRKEKLTIIFPIITLSLGGAQRMLAELANGLSARGHHVIILMPQEGALEYPIRAQVHRTKHPYSIVESDYPYGDLIISNYYTIVPSAAEASANGKGVHTRLSLCYEPTFLPENHVTFPTYHVTKHILVLSSWQQKLVALIHGLEGHIIPGGVSSAFNNIHIRKPKGPLQISAIMRKPEGGYSWHREQNYLINQLEIVQTRYPDVQINIFTPPHEFASSPMLQAVKATHSFRYLTPADDREMCYHYNETDIFVSSSTFDTASLPGLEAMKCGAALVTVYAGGNMDYCRHEHNCLMSYRFEHRLAEHIIRLITDSELRARLAIEGEKEAAKWTWERSISAFEHAARKILNER